jgi:hypothetical protein
LLAAVRRVRLFFPGCERDEAALDFRAAMTTTSLKMDRCGGTRCSIFMPLNHRDAAVRSQSLIEIMQI